MMSEKIEIGKEVEKEHTDNPRRGFKNSIRPSRAKEETIILKQ